MPEGLARKAFDLLVVKGYLAKRQVVTQGLKLAKAGNLPPEMLTVYLQVKVDGVGSVRSNNARRLYHLTAEDLQACDSKKHKHNKAGVPTQCSYNKQILQEHRSCCELHSLVRYTWPLPTGCHCNCKPEMGQLEGPPTAQSNTTWGPYDQEVC